jgi:hypothetical protein
MKECWLVSKGEYSDYRIVAAFSTEEKANDFVKSAEGSEYCVESVSFDCFENPPRHVQHLCMDMRTGDVIGSWDTVDQWSDRYDKIFLRHQVFVSKSRRTIEGFFLEITVDTPDQAEAVKVASEKRAQLNAQNISQCGVYNRSTLALENRWNS